MPEQSKLTEANIDTVERAIVYSATLLKAHYTNDEEDKATENTIQITHNRSGNGSYTISIKADLPYDNVTALVDGGVIINNLKAKVETESLQTSYKCSPSPSEYPIIPSNINFNFQSLEQYFFYHCSLLKASLEPADNSIVIDYLESEPDGGKASLKLALPLDFNAWLLGGNYTCSVQNKVDSYINLSPYIESEVEEQPDLENDGEMNNNYSMEN